MNKIIKDKIDELISLVLLILRGAQESGDNGLLARKIKEFAKDVLLPRAKMAKELQDAQNN